LGSNGQTSLFVVWTGPAWHGDAPPSGIEYPWRQETKGPERLRETHGRATDFHTRSAAYPEIQ
jgi:hypothetical protein